MLRSNQRFERYSSKQTNKIGGTITSALSAKKKGYSNGDSHSLAFYLHGVGDT